MLKNNGLRDKRLTNSELQNNELERSELERNELQKDEHQNNKLTTHHTSTDDNPILTRIPRLSETDWYNLGLLPRWFVMVRGPVLVMTMSAALVGIMLAAGQGPVNPLDALAILAGLTLAHATNNLVNDWVDHAQGTDRDNYFRRQYGTHVLEDGLVSPKQFLVTVLITGGLAAACGAWLIIKGGWPVVYLTLAGAFFVLFYTWPLKHFALGEIAVLLVWGPMMVGGSYYVLTGHTSAGVLAISVVAAIGPTLVILGKHIDKLDQDANRSIHTLPVILGDNLARRLSRAMLVIHWVITTALIILLQVWALLPCLLALPAARRCFNAFSAPRPQDRPAGYPGDVWPLWFAAQGFGYARIFGVMMISGLAMELGYRYFY